MYTAALRKRTHGHKEVRKASGVDVQVGRQPQQEPPQQAAPGALPRRLPGHACAAQRRHRDRHSQCHSAIAIWATPRWGPIPCWSSRARQLPPYRTRWRAQVHYISARCTGSCLGVNVFAARKQQAYCCNLGHTACDSSICKQQAHASRGGACLQAKKGSTKGFGPVCTPHPSHSHILLVPSTVQSRRT